MSPNFLILSPRISVTHFASPGCLWAPLAIIISVGAQLTLGQDIFARKCMYEKLIKCAAKTGFKIKSYIPCRREMKTEYSKKINGACSSFFQKYINYQLPECCMMFAQNIFSEIGGGANAPPTVRLLRLWPLSNKISTSSSTADC